MIWNNDHLIIVIICSVFMTSWLCIPLFFLWILHILHLKSNVRYAICSYIVGKLIPSSKDHLIFWMEISVPDWEHSVPEKWKYQDSWWGGQKLQFLKNDSLLQKSYNNEQLYKELSKYQLFQDYPAIYVFVFLFFYYEVTINIQIILQEIVQIGLKSNIKIQLAPIWNFKYLTKITDYLLISFVTRKQLSF